MKPILRVCQFPCLFHHGTTCGLCNLRLPWPIESEPPDPIPSDLIPERLPSEATWNNMIANLEAKYSKPRKKRRGKKKKKKNNKFLKRGSYVLGVNLVKVWRKLPKDVKKRKVKINGRTTLNTLLKNLNLNTIKINALLRGGSQP